MNWPLFFVFLSPAIWALMNFIDAWIVKRRVKNALAFAVVSGITNILLGIILALFLSWKNYSLFDFRFSILVGLMLGTQLYFYYAILSKHDVSHIVGLVYAYPLVVAVLSFIFLNERLSLTGYIGAFIIILGVFMMTLRMRKLNFALATWSIIMVVLTSAFAEFFIKIATTQIPVWHSTSVTSIILGMSILPALLKKSVRKDFKNEFKKIHFTFFSEILTICAVTTLYLAMTGFPATIVSVISTTQPLFVLLFEWLAFFFGIKMVKDMDWKHKIFAISLIVIGIAILYGKEIV